MIHLDRPVTSVRRLLRQLRRPHLLERDPLAARLRDRLNAKTCGEAIEQLVDRTFARDASSERVREVIMRCDFHGQKATAAAAGMHLSLRQFFRCRAEAMEALALAIERLDDIVESAESPKRPAYCSLCSALIVNP